MAERKETVQFVRIGPEEDGQRLDNYLFRNLKGVPKSRVYRMIRDGEVRVNKGRKGPDYRVQLEDEIRIPPVRLAEVPTAVTVPVGSSLLPHILYRDEAMLVLNKPAGWAVHGGSGISLGVIEQLRQELPELRYLELVHRLDRETSGLLMLASRRSALVELHRMMQAGEVQKTYLALGAGRWRDAVRHVRLSLHKFLTAEGERRVEVVKDDHPEAMRAHTIFRLQQRYAGFSLLEAELKTGRTHQIRVHLAALGHAIAGDTKYAEASANTHLKIQGLRRMFLHAARLTLKHPLTRQDLAFTAPLPDELAAFLKKLQPDTP
ncbi:MAG: RluA family pseudouridine synthase [Betaproteobacteria bacterium]|jgi:23S rRNA pseudouridine955/2504/2580 synthase|nr:MAG: RluA family pseudouridine synthase [Betaproteobacteria bacterium]